MSLDPAEAPSVGKGLKASVTHLKTYKTIKWFGGYKGAQQDTQETHYLKGKR